LKDAIARSVIPSEARNLALLPVRRARFLASLGMTGLAVSEVMQGFSTCKTWISGGTIVKDTFGSDGSQEKGQL